MPQICIVLKRFLLKNAMKKITRCFKRLSHTIAKTAVILCCFINNTPSALGVLFYLKCRDHQRIQQAEQNGKSAETNRGETKGSGSVSHSQKADDHAERTEHERIKRDGKQREKERHISYDNARIRFESQQIAAFTFGHVQTSWCQLGSVFLVIVMMQTILFDTVQSSQWNPSLSNGGIPILRIV